MESHAPRKPTFSHGKWRGPERGESDQRILLLSTKVPDPGCPLLSEAQLELLFNMSATKEGNDPIREVVEKQLASTPFVCSSLSRLSGGTANFVYRGTPTTGNPESIIIKHTENYLSSNSSFQLDAARCVCLESILRPHAHNLTGFDSILKGLFWAHFMVSIHTKRTISL